MSNYFIVGGASGIGNQLVKLLLESGHRVYATYNKNKMVSDIPELEYHYCNVLDEQIRVDYLPNSLNGLVYCPGSINLRPFQRLQPEDFLSDFELQVVGAVKIMQASLSRLKASGNASVIFFSTVAVQLGFPFHSQVAASKGAVEGLTKSLSAELAPQIRVNCIAPSLTDTPLAVHLLGTEEKRNANAQRHPLKKIGSPADLAHMAEFLLSQKSGWITGQILHIDGGMSTIKT